MNLRTSIYQLFKIELFRQSFFYIFVGSIATAVDWSSFYFFSSILGADYRLAVTISFSFGATTHYILNKTITFRDRTKKLAAQLGIYFVLLIVTVILSVLLMHMLVGVIGIVPMLARVLTTPLMLTVNFLMHKFLTFNPKFYRSL